MHPRYNVTKHLLDENLSILTCKRQTTFDFQHIFIVDKPSERCTVSLQTGEVGYIFPLYLYTGRSGQQMLSESSKRVPNFRAEIVEKIAKGTGLCFYEEKSGNKGQKEANQFYPIDVLDYIYAILYSPTYREKYKEFLKIDFPRIPYPTDAGLFFELVGLGKQIRELHLLKSPEINEFITSYPISGSNIVEKPNYKDGKVYINEGQYFDNVPEMAWDFYIGGYQPAQKWLKDRKGRGLEFDDVLHYQKMIVALTETDRLMKEVDKVLEV